MGFKTGTLLAPDVLRQYCLPWQKRFAAMAHDKGRPYFLHSCGNLAAIMEDLIEDVRIDGKHSYENAIMPVQEFQKKSGQPHRGARRPGHQHPHPLHARRGAQGDRKADGRLRSARPVRRGVGQLRAQLHPGGELPGHGGGSRPAPRVELSLRPARSAAPPGMLIPLRIARAGRRPKDLSGCRTPPRRSTRRRTMSLPVCAGVRMGRPSRRSKTSRSAGLSRRALPDPTSAETCARRAAGMRS